MDREIKDFYDLIAWQKGHQLVLQIYTITNTFPTSEQFGITSQLRRAASSITANIAEGFERYHFKDKIRFYHQARGSTSEVVNFLLLAKDLQYIETQVSTTLKDNADEVRKLINGMIRAIEKQS